MNWKPRNWTPKINDAPWYQSQVQWMKFWEQQLEYNNIENKSTWHHWPQEKGNLLEVLPCLHCERPLSCKLQNKQQTCLTIIKCQISTINTIWRDASNSFFVSVYLFLKNYPNFKFRPWKVFLHLRFPKGFICIFFSYAIYWSNKIGWCGTFFYAAAWFLNLKGIISNHKTLVNISNVDH